METDSDTGLYYAKGNTEMGKKKNLLSENTFVSAPTDELIITKSATIHCGRLRRLEAHGKTKQLNRKVVGIGRSKENAIIVADPKVSKFHAILSFKNTGAWIRDTGSTNGTRVNGERLLRDKERELNEGDVIVVGSTKLAIRYGA